MAKTIRIGTVPKRPIFVGLLLLLLLSSCRTQYVAMPEVHSRDSLVTRVNTRVDSIYEGHFRQEKQRGDTLLIHDSVYVEKYRYLAKHDTVTVTHTDTISIAVPVQSPALSSSAAFWGRGAMKWWGRGFLFGGIGAVVLLLLLRIAVRLYLRR